jgi:hypothetical protein
MVKGNRHLTKTIKKAKKDGWKLGQKVQKLSEFQTQ